MTSATALEAAAGIWGVFFLVILPGWTLYNLVGAQHPWARTRLVLQIALGLVFMAFVGLALSLLGRIDTSSIYFVYGTMALLAVIVLVRRRRNWKASIGGDFLGRILSRRLGFAILPFLLTLLFWSSYIDAHTADGGIHAFWSGWIVSSGDLPDYSVAGPSIPSVIFVYGPHLFLAMISLVSSIPTTDLFWVPLLFLYWAILLAIQSIALQVTKSETVSVLASLFYTTSQVPAARVLLGNLPDLSGYFLLSAVVVALFSALNGRSILITAVIAPSVIVYYQYALLSEVLLLIFLSAFFAFRFMHKRGPGLSAVRNYGRFWIPVLVAIVETLLLVSQVSYLNRGSVDLLRSTRWSPLSVLDYVSNLGNASIFIVGSLGLVALLHSGFKGNVGRFSSGLVLGSWVLALTAASGGPWVGVGVEPIRFVWHLVEPLSIASGILLVMILDGVCGSANRRIAAAGISVSIVYSSETARRRAAGIVLLALITALILVPSQVPVYGSRAVSEPFFFEDVGVGKWLADHSDPTSGVAINSDVDVTGTWVQAYSLTPRFFYRADYAINISAAPFSYVYRDMARLFKNPGSPDALTIVHRYDISYVVVHRPDYPAFYRANEYFLQVYASPNGNATIFKPTS